MNYLTITRRDIAFIVAVVSQFLSTLRTTHWDTIPCILKYLKLSSGKGLLHTDCRYTRVAGFSLANCAESPDDRLSP